MIIGYSFGDANINQMIFSGIEAGLKIFIIDPLGADVIGSNPSMPLNPGSPLEMSSSVLLGVPFSIPSRVGTWLSKIRSTGSSERVVSL
jgi:hypothetical protein